MDKVWAVFLHDGSYSDYSCIFLGVCGSFERAIELAESDAAGLRSQDYQDTWGSVPVDHLVFTWSPHDSLQPSASAPYWQNDHYARRARYYEIVEATIVN